MIGCFHQSHTPCRREQIRHQQSQKKKKNPQNMTPCITTKELIIDLEGASDSECETQDLKPLVVFTVRY